MQQLHVYERVFKTKINKIHSGFDALGSQMYHSPGPFYSISALNMDKKNPDYLNQGEGEGGEC